MAKRTLRPQHSDEIREKIKASQLVNVLQEYAITGTYQGHELSPARINAALGLLRKSVPDLASTDMTLTHQESYSASLQRIAEARKPTQSASITPIAAPLSDDNDTDSTEDAA